MKYGRCAVSARWLVFAGLAAGIGSLASNAGVTREADVRLREINQAVARVKDTSVPVEERLGPLIAALRRELTSPVTDDGVRQHGTYVTPSQLAKTSALNGIAKCGDEAGLQRAIASETDSRVRDLLITSRSMMQARERLPVASEDWRELIDVIRRADERYVRYRAIRAMDEVAESHPPYRDEAVAVARSVLENPALRFRSDEPEFPGALDLAQAAECLLVLGVDVTPNADGTYTVRQDSRAQWVELREVLANGGYQVRWDQADRRADVTRGGFVARLWAGRAEAEVGGGRVVMEEAAFVSAGRLYIPRSFASTFGPVQS